MATTKQERWARRYESEAVAIEAAKRYSAVDRSRPYYVIESPHVDSPDAGRFVVDTDGFVGNRDRYIACYEAGTKSD